MSKVDKDKLPPLSKEDALASFIEMVEYTLDVKDQETIKVYADTFMLIAEAYANKRVKEALKEEREAYPLADIQINVGLTDDNGSWLDHHILNEDSEIEGVIIKHPHDPNTFGGVSIRTKIGNFAIVKEDQEKAAKNKGGIVLIKPHKDYYATVIILEYLDKSLT